MRIWKQVGISLAVVAIGLCLWGLYTFDSSSLLAKVGFGKTETAATPTADAGAARGGASGGQQGQQRGGGGGRGSNATLVVTAPVAQGTVNDRLNAIGNGQAIQSVMVMPQATGTVSEILISSGDKVTKGQTLAKLDDDEQIIARNQAQVAVKSAEEKMSLYNNIKSTVSRMDVFDASITEENAKLQLDTAKLNLERRNIVAPIDGVVGIVAVNIGDNVGTQSNIVAIDDRSAILVNFWAPERFTNAIKVGMPIEATSIARPGPVFSGKVESVDNRLDEASRTVRVRARVENSDDQLRAGMSFGVTMHFPGETYPAVDPLAVQWDAVGSYVWRVKDKKAEKVRVTIVQRNPDAVLVSAELAQGDEVVTEGLLRLREGGDVRRAGEARSPEVASQ